MNEHPILFSTEMVQAILTGRKTQTRRVVKSELIIEQAEFERGNRPNVIQSEPSLQYWTENSCPFGQVGDRLWVRETWYQKGTVGRTYPDDDEYQFFGHRQAAYVADGDAPKDWTFKKRPSIHMPRWACRLILEITNIRIERLNDISEADCVKEGIGSALLRDCKRPKFMQLWESINGTDSWDKNPWVWVVEFKVIQGGAV